MSSTGIGWALMGKEIFRFVCCCINMDRVCWMRLGFNAVCLDGAVIYYTGNSVLCTPYRYCYVSISYTVQSTKVYMLVSFLHI